MDRCPFERESSLFCLRGFAFPVRGCDFLAGESSSVPVAGLPVLVAICFACDQHCRLEIILVEKRSEAVVVGIQSPGQAAAPAVDLNDVVVRIPLVRSSNEQVEASGIYFSIPVDLKTQVDWAERLEKGPRFGCVYVGLPALEWQGRDPDSGEN